MSGQEGAPKKKGFKLPHFKAAPGSEAELEQASKLLTSLGQRCAGERYSLPAAAAAAAAP